MLNHVLGISDPSTLPQYEFANPDPYQIILEPICLLLASLCGPFDAHLKQIERRLGIIIKNRGNDFQLFGEHKVVHAAGELLNHLYREVNGGTDLTSELVHLFLQESGVEQLMTGDDNDDCLIVTRKKSISRA